jgi:anthranilate phosphoribosyltransferase
VGEATSAQVAALLMGLRVRGETAEIVAAVARSLRGAMVALPVDRPDELVDTCGTGGGSVPTFNISTAPRCWRRRGRPVAKHGNRSFTSRSGSADVLEALGVPIERPVDVMRGRSRRPAWCSCSRRSCTRDAPRGPRARELAIPTVMNVVGPLANPASLAARSSASRSRTGCRSRRGLGRAGTVHAMVVHGEPGMDEISPLGPTRVIEVRGSAGDELVREWTIDPASFGLATASVDELAGGSPAENAAVITDVLAGRGTPGRGRPSC